MTEKRSFFSLGESLAIVANVGVIIGLLFVWLEIRQNELQLQAEVELSLATAYQTAHGRLVDSAEFSDVVQTAYADPASLTASEYMQLMSYHAEWMALVFATYQLWRADAITEDIWKQHSGYYLLFLQTPWMQEFWRGMIHDELYPQHFLDDLEARLPDTGNQLVPE